MINVNVHRCVGHDYCKSEEEIDYFLDRSYMIMLSNQIKFDYKKYGEESIVNESIISIIQLNS